MPHRRAGFVALATSLAILVAAPLAAQGPDSTTPPAPPEQVTIFVIDLSGSMNEPFAGGGTKLDAAKQAFVTAFQDAVGRGGKIAVRTYGDQYPSAPPAARQTNCEQDTRLAVPLTDLSTGADPVVNEVNSFQGVGDTPVGLALQAAATDIPTGALGTIVLFSDGRDECHDADLDGNPAAGPSWGPDPCEVAASLKAAGVDVRTGVSRVETIGFVPDEGAESELRCIAERTGGTYTPIRSPDDLESLQTLLIELAAPRTAIRLGGTPIVGASTNAGAPTISDLQPGEEVGHYTDQLLPNEERWYRAPTYGPRSGNFTVTVFDLPAQEDLTLSVALEGAPGANFNPLEQSRTDVGIPRSPSASIRCPGCYWQSSDEDIDTYFKVLLASAEPLAGTFDIEIDVEGEAFGGQPLGCNEPAECFYTGQIAKLKGLTRQYEAEADELVGQSASPEQAAERDELAAQVADLEATLADPNHQTTTISWLPVVLALVVALAGIAFGGFMFSRRRPTTTAVGPGEDLPAARTGVLHTQATHAGEDRPAPPSSRSSNATLPVGLTAVSRPDGVAPPSEPTGADRSNETPAGWYPQQDGTERYWDGEAWTERRREPGEDSAAAEVPQAVAPASDAAPAEGTPVPPPPGWYADPKGEAELRWWDGRAWTDSVR